MVDVIEERISFDHRHELQSIRQARYVARSVRV